MNHSKNYNNHQKSCNSDLFWKERNVCMLACVRMNERRTLHVCYMLGFRT